MSSYVTLGAVDVTESRQETSRQVKVSNIQDVRIIQVKRCQVKSGKVIKLSSIKLLLS